MSADGKVRLQAARPTPTVSAFFKGFRQAGMCPQVSPGPQRIHFGFVDLADGIVSLFDLGCSHDDAYVKFLGLGRAAQVSADHT